MWWVGLVSEGWLGPTRFLKGELVRQVSVRARVFGAVLVGVLLAGCNGEPGPEETSSETVTTTTSAPTSSASTVTSSPSPSESVTPQPSETSVLPPLPDAAKENTAEGAEAFIRYYYEVVNELFMNPPPVNDIATVIGDDLVDPECVSCGNLRSEVTEFSKGGWRTLGPIHKIDSISPIGGGPPGVQRFNMSVTMLDSVVVSTSGEEHPREGRDIEGVGAAIWSGERWVIYDMELG